MSRGVARADLLNDLLWSDRLDDLPAPRRQLVWFGRVVHALIRDLTQGYLSLQAMSLVYTTLLSLVPLLAVSFSVLKGFGVHNQLEPLLMELLSPLGERAEEATMAIIGFVDNMKVGVLGSLGLVLLLYTVITLIQKVEQVFNYTWRVEVQRPFAQRFSQYLSVLLVGPVLFFSAVAFSSNLRGLPAVAAILTAEPFGTLIDAVSRVLPSLLLALTFAFIYVFVPNTRVRLRSALIGGLVAAVLWQSVGWLFAKFIVKSTQYTAIYSSLAIVILFMIWVYVAWLILLVGANVAFYHQHPEYLISRSRDLKLSNRLRERLALVVAGHVARSYLRGAPAWSGEGLSGALRIPKANTQRILDLLVKEGFLLRSGDDPPRYLPARAPETIEVKTLLDGVRCFEEQQSGCRGTAPDFGIQEIESRIDGAIGEALGAMTLRDLAQTLGEARAAVQDSDNGVPPDGLPKAEISSVGRGGNLEIQ
jgi:membrane protein